ncbi:MAG: TolC family protein [Bacteroidales bacterium]|nr:TolC family protein [Bacteroidales bacterium]
MKKTLFVLILSLPTILWAQEPWSLERCIGYALENNLQVKQQVLNVELSESQLQQSRLSTLPSLNVSGNHGYSFGRVTNYKTNEKEKQNSQSTSFSVSSSLSLFDGFQKYNTQKLSRYNLQASVHDVDKVKNNIALAIASAYLQILYQQELVDVAKRQFEQSQMQVDRTQKLLTAGSVPEGTLLEVEALLASDELALISAQNQLESDYLTLAQLLEIKNPSELQIQKPEIPALDSSAIVFTVGDVYSSAELCMPQILGSQVRVKSAEMDVKIARGAYYPSLNLNGNYNTGAQSYINTSNPLLSTDPFFTQIKDNATTTVSLNLSIPIFNGGTTRHRVSSAKISLDNAQLSLESERNALYKDIQKAYTDALGAQKKLIANAKSKAANEESFRYSENKFSLGLINAFDYTTARNNYSKAQTDLLYAKYELLFKLKILDFYKGTPLKL